MIKVFSYEGFPGVFIRRLIKLVVVLKLYVHGQQLWSCRNGQLTEPHTYPGQASFHAKRTTKCLRNQGRTTRRGLVDRNLIDY